MILRLRALADRARESLFFVPALYIVLAVIGAWAMVKLDNRLISTLDQIPILLRSTVSSARSTLSTMAGATITVAGIVFSVTVVSVQLASSQFSPRVMRNFLRDRFSQHVIGVVMGTFTYCLLVLTTVRARPEVSGEAAPTVAVTVAVVLGIMSVIAIVAFIDHSARIMQVGQLIDRIGEETLALIDRVMVDSEESGGDEAIDDSVPERPGDAIRSPKEGWVQQIDHHALLQGLPPGSTIRLTVTVGDHVVQDQRVATLWIPDGEEADIDRGAALAIGNRRTMQEDISFGIRQLVDVGLRALSPGINDPTTAYESLGILSSILARLLRRDLPPRVVEGDEGRRVLRAADLTHDDYVRRAFDQIRIAAGSQPAVLIAILRRLADLRDLLVDQGFEDRTGPLYRQAHLVLATLKESPVAEEDREFVAHDARKLGLIEDET